MTCRVTAIAAWATGASVQRRLGLPWWLRAFRGGYGFGHGVGRCAITATCEFRKRRVRPDDGHADSFQADSGHLQHITCMSEIRWRIRSDGVEDAGANCAREFRTVRAATLRRQWLEFAVWQLDRIKVR